MSEPSDWQLIAYADPTVGDPAKPPPSEWAMTIETMDNELWVKVLGQLYRFPLNEMRDALNGRANGYECRGTIECDGLWVGQLATTPKVGDRGWARRCWRYLTEPT